MNVVLLIFINLYPGRAGGDEVASGVATLLDISRATHLVGTANSTFFLLAAALSSCEQNASASFWVVRKHLCVNVECDLRGKCAAKMAWVSTHQVVHLHNTICASTGVFLPATVWRSRVN